jgi:hypothetical protein
MSRLARVALMMLCGLAVPGIADAKVKAAPTQIAFIDGTSESITGAVSSPAKRCVRDRTVRLHDMGTDAAFHATTTDRAGQFSIAVSDIPPDGPGFQARVGALTVGSKECEAASTDVESDFVTLSGGPHDGAFTGVLNSSLPACEPGRMISLFEISGGEPVFVGFDLADSSGAWSISQATGSYEAHADPMFALADGFVFCRAVTSFPWTFEEPPPE